MLFSVLAAASSSCLHLWAGTILQRCNYQRENRQRTQVLKESKGSGTVRPALLISPQSLHVPFYSSLLLPFLYTHMLALKDTACTCLLILM